MYNSEYRVYYNPMTTTTTSVIDAPYTPNHPDLATNFLVRVQYEYDITDYVVFGPVTLTEAELLELIKQRYPRDEATAVVRWAKL